MLAAPALGLGVALLLGRHLAGLIVKPIRSVHTVLTPVAAGDLTAAADIAQRDEAGETAPTRQPRAGRKPPRPTTPGRSRPHSTVATPRVHR